jgi:shikimate dehydrogenase
MRKIPITGHTELIGLIATPIRHSMSPAMHNAAFEKLGMDRVYLVFEVGKEGLEATVNGLRAMGVRGWNVSMPNKTAIIPYLDKITPAAEMCGAVNTVINDNGVLTGTITDGTGWVQSVREQGVDLTGKKMTLLGAGGAATAILVQAALDGLAEISVFNRKKRPQWFRKKPAARSTCSRWTTKRRCGRRSLRPICWPTRPAPA